MSQASAPAPPRTFPSSFFLYFYISIPAKQYKDVKKAELHKSLPVLLFSFQHAQNSLVICIT
jgi:hypothetical protein